MSLGPSQHCPEPKAPLLLAPLQGVPSPPCCSISPPRAHLFLEGQRPSLSSWALRCPPLPRLGGFCPNELLPQHPLPGLFRASTGQRTPALSCPSLSPSHRAAIHVRSCPLQPWGRCQPQPYSPSHASSVELPRGPRAGQAGEWTLPDQERPVKPGSLPPPSALMGLVGPGHFRGPGS